MTMARVKKIPQQINGVCDENCHDCFFYRGAWETHMFCHYYLMTGKRRPCDPGKGCTVKIPMKVNRRKKKGNANHVKN